MNNKPILSGKIPPEAYAESSYLRTFKNSASYSYFKIL